MNRLSLWWQRVHARIHYAMALLHRYYGNRDHLPSEHMRAIEALNRAIACDPTNARAYLVRGILWWRELDHPRRAVLDLTEAYRLNPRLAEARFNRGVAYQQLREYDKAIADFEAYLEVGNHPYWREYAREMVEELRTWTHDAADSSS